jgi:hypothetical protein
MSKQREMNRQHRKERKRGPIRQPSFMSGIIAEPLLSFGGQHRHIDPKTGLGLYGPYSLSSHRKPFLSGIAVGCVGPGNMVADAEQWLSACRGRLMNSGKEPLQNPHFPGFNRDFPFQCEFQFGDPWREMIRKSDIDLALRETNFYERIKRVVDLYLEAIEVLAGRDPKPNVILCCIPQDVIDLCTVRTTQTGEVKRRRIGKTEKKALEAVAKGQYFLFPNMDPTLSIEDEIGGHQNLRRGLKAEAMRFEIPTQLVWPRTLRLTKEESMSGTAASQDIATRAWNFTTAVYHKAGGSPWRLAEVTPNTCFIGVSFYREIEDRNPRIRTAMAQAFTSSGDGYVLRGSSFEWDESKQGRSPHLDENSAADLMRGVLDLYKRQNQGSLPNRVVVHKTSRFWEEELTGFRTGCEIVPQSDFVAFGWRGLQFYRPGLYPPLRGTYVKFSDTDLMLYTVGYVPYLKTYPGARVPQPLEVVVHHGDSPWNLILEEIMSLTKMNWNTAAFACSEPITIAFSRRVGQILAELGPKKPMRSEYRFYM